MIRSYSLPMRYRVYPSIFILAALAFLITSVEARAQSASPCDSCAAPRDLARKWGEEGDALARFELRSGTRGALIDHVRRIARETIYLGGRPRQALHVWYGAGDRCRDTLIAADESFLLRRSSGSASRQADIPILPAREFACDDLLSTDGPFIGGSAMMMTAGREAMAGEDEFDKATVGLHLHGGAPIVPDLEVALASEVFSMHGRVRIPVFGFVRWSPFGGTRTESELHYVPGACQFMAPGDAALRPPKSLCSPVSVVAQSDTTVYAVEERWAVPVPFSLFLYGEAGVVFNGGGFVAIEQGPSLDNHIPTKLMGGAGIGMPVIAPLFVTLGYRYWELNGHALVVSIGAELR